MDEMAKEIFKGIQQENEKQFQKLANNNNSMHEQEKMLSKRRVV